MRKSASAAAAAVLVAAVFAWPTGGLASHGGDGPREFATGSGTNQFIVALGEAHLSVSAHRDPATGDVTGHVRAKGDPDGTGQMPFALEGEVTCLNVEGNRAALKYVFKTADGSTEPFQDGGVQIFLEDNGRPANGEAVDGATFDPPQPAGAFQADAHRCDDPRLRLYDPITSGDFVIHDVAP